MAYETGHAYENIMLINWIFFNFIVGMGEGNYDNKAFEHNTNSLIILEI